MHNEDADPRANAERRTFAYLGEILKTCHSDVSKKMLCSKGKQLHRGKMLSNTCGSEDDTAHVTQTHGNMKSSIRQLKRHGEHKGTEQVFFFFLRGKQ